MDQDLRRGELGALSIKQAAAALIFHTLGLDVYHFLWKPLVGKEHESFFSCCDVPVIISERIH